MEHSHKIPRDKLIPLLELCTRQLCVLLPKQVLHTTPESRYDFTSLSCHTKCSHLEFFDHTIHWNHNVYKAHTYRQLFGLELKPSYIDKKVCHYRHSSIGQKWYASYPRAIIKEMDWPSSNFCVGTVIQTGSRKKKKNTRPQMATKPPPNLNNTIQRSIVSQVPLHPRAYWGI